MLALITLPHLNHVQALVSHAGLIDVEAQDVIEHCSRIGTTLASVYLVV